jgi:hypothetical protein
MWLSKTFGMSKNTAYVDIILDIRLFSERLSRIICLFVDRRLIGRKFRVNFGFLPGFGSVMTFAFIQ